MILGIEDIQIQDSLQHRWLDVRRNDSAGWKTEDSRDRVVGPRRNLWRLQKKKKWRLLLAGSASINSSGYSQKVLRELKELYHPRRKRRNRSPKWRRKYLLRKTKLLSHQGKTAGFSDFSNHSSKLKETTKQKQKGLSWKRDRIPGWAQSCKNWKAHTHT